MSQHHRRRGWMASGLAGIAVLASQLHAPPRVWAEPPAPTVSRPAPVPDAAAEAQAALQAAGLRERWSMPEDAIERARQAGIDEARVARWLETIQAACLAMPGRCEDPLAPPAWSHELTGRLLAVLGEIGTAASLPLLRRLDARGVYQAGMARTRIHERAMLQAVAQSPCAPPSASEIQSMRDQLDDFAVVRVRAGRLVAERPTSAELDDLSYFLAAVAQSGAEVGHLPGHARASWTSPAPASPERDRLAGDLDAARLRGDLPAMARHAAAYLATLGYPRAMRFEHESTYAWGGARYSYVMRDLAEVSEDLGQLGQLGQLRQAAELYRHADPGGGACGTSVDYRWQEQVQGVIRASERQGQCRAVVAERLLGIDETLGGDVYGTTRLRAAGFDLERLYRGALITRHRDLDPAELERVLAQAPDGLGPAALQRLARRGPEDWARRVHAVRGLADTAQRAALPMLIEITASSTPAVAVEALTAIADLAEKPPYDPCGNTWGSGSFGNMWQRPIRSLGRSCETHLDARARTHLAKSLMPFVRHASADVRKAARSARQRILHGAPD